MATWYVVLIICSSCAPLNLNTNTSSHSPRRTGGPQAPASGACRVYLCSCTYVVTTAVCFTPFSICIFLQSMDNLMSMCDNHCTLYPQQVPPQLLRMNYRGRLLFMSMVSVWHGIWLLKNSTVQNGIWYIFIRFSANTTVQNGIYGRNGTVSCKLYGFKRYGIW